MFRTTPELVSGIVEVDPLYDLTPFIETANVLVTELCVPVGYTDERLELIERWLSAHFYRCFDKEANREEAGDRVQDYRVPLGKNLQATIYGQQAAMLDTSGALAAASTNAMEGPTVVGVTWMGKRYCE